MVNHTVKFRLFKWVVFDWRPSNFLIFVVVIHEVAVFVVPRRVTMYYVALVASMIDFL